MARRPAAAGLNRQDPANQSAGRNCPASPSAGTLQVLMQGPEAPQASVKH